jgi:HTH-type transcriptional regulator/antitoxin HigA
MSKATDGAVPGNYLKLIRRFPLIQIRDDDHLDEARDVIEGVLAKEPDEGAQAYLDVLTDLVEPYEDAHIEIPNASEADVLRELMQANSLTQTQLAKKVGIQQSTISAVLNGNRSLTKRSVLKLATLFNISPAVFLKV